MQTAAFEVKVIWRAMGLVLTCDEIAKSTAPMLAAALRDHSGHDANSFAILMC